MMLINSIHFVGGVGNSFLIEREDYCIVIDAGYDKNARKIISTIENKCSNKPLKYAIITHAHPDHIGGIEKLRELFNVEVVIHEDEKDYALGKPYPIPTNINGKAFKLVTRILTPRTCNIDHTVKDKETFEGLKIHHTPGHTPGSIIIEEPKIKAIFTGDTIISGRIKPRIVKPSKIFSIDYDLALKSAVETLKQVKPITIFPGHGKPLINASSDVERFLDKYANRFLNS